MKKNPFKKKSLTDTLVNVGIGGAANVAIDYVWNAAGLDNTLSFEGVSSSTIKNGIKILGGAVVGGMVSNQYARAAADGVATVGVSNLLSGFINSSESESDSGDNISGLPQGTIGRARRFAGSPRYAQKVRNARGGKVNGLDDFMGD